MRKPRFVVGLLAAAASLAAAAAPTAAQGPTRGERPTVTLDAVTWHEPGTLTVQGTYSCPADGGTLGSVQVWTEQRDVPNDTWIAGYAVTAESEACDGEVHPFEAPVESEDGNYDPAVPIRVEAMAMTVEHRMSLVESYFLPEPAT